MTSIFTVPAFIIVISVITAVGQQEQAVIVMDSVQECDRLEKIIDNDFLLLREAEKDMDGEELVPRIHLNSVKCWAVDIPLNAREARENL